MAKPTAKAEALTQGVTTHRNVPTTIVSTHIITLTNDQPTAKIFEVNISLCADRQPRRCHRELHYITLVKGQTLTRTYPLKSMLVFQRQGTQSITATTEVTGSAVAVGYDYKFVDVLF